MKNTFFFRMHFRNCIFWMLLILVLLGGGGCEKFVYSSSSGVKSSTDVLQKDVLWRFSGKTMGTTYSVVVRPPASAIHNENAKKSLAKKVDNALAKVNSDMSTWLKDSDLSLFNAHLKTSVYHAKPTTAAVVQRALDLAKQTHGAFDVTLGPLIRLWGFDHDGRRKSPPSDEEIAKAKRRVGWQQVTVRHHQLVKTRADVEVNLSGIAKGYGVDQALKVLKSEKMLAGLIEVGGELAAFGEKGNGKKWQVGIAVPKKDAALNEASHSLPLENQALATSGDYRNFFEDKNVRYSHIIDPITGRPIRHDLVSASILAKDCTTADGLATAMLVMGEKDGRALIESLANVEGMFIRKIGTNFVVSTTAGFPKTVSFLENGQEGVK